MKKILLIAILIIPAFKIIAQTEPAKAERPDTTINKWVYCEIVGTQKLLSFGTKVTVEVDYGQKRKVFVGQQILNDEGKIKSFNSMVDAMNYLGDQGWEFVQAYVVTTGNQNVYHWLLRANKNGPVFFPPVRK